MAITYKNTDGAIGLFDGGTPRTITFMARENISGGYWVLGSSANAVVGSTASTYVSSDIEGYVCSTQVGSNPIGLCIQTVASGTYGTAARRGDFLLPCLSGTKIGSIYSGQSICAGSAGTVVPYTSGTVLPLTDTAGWRQFTCGRAMTTGGDGGDSSFVIVSLNI